MITFGMITFGTGIFVITIFLKNSITHIIITFNIRMDGKDDCKAESAVFKFVINPDRNYVPRIL